jgi:hypothetical protein
MLVSHVSLLLELYENTGVSASYSLFVSNVVNFSRELLNSDTKMYMFFQYETKFGTAKVTPLSPF